MAQPVVAYYRVSTEKQGRSGLGLEAQRDSVMRYATEHQFDVAEEFTETESGALDDRPQLVSAIRSARKNNAVLIVAKLDRLSRNATFLLKFDDLVKRASIDFRVVDQPHLDRFTLGLHALVAERERTLISERTKAALAAAKRRGVILGTRTPDILRAMGLNALKAQAIERADTVRPIIRQFQSCGIVTYKGLADALNRCGIQSPRHGKWHAESVRRIIYRIQA